jgi:hypothetical protein
LMGLPNKHKHHCGDHGMAPQGVARHSDVCTLISSQTFRAY